jgi:hypothetical protein
MPDAPQLVEIGLQLQGALERRNRSGILFRLEFEPS